MLPSAKQSEFDRTCQDILTQCACEALRRTSRAVTSRYQVSLRTVGITAGQLPILVAAQLMGPVPLSPLASQLGMDRTTLTRNLSGLQAADLVSIERDADRRVRLVAITPAGRRALRRATRAWREAQSHVVSAFGRDRMRSLLGELEALASVAAR